MAKKLRINLDALIKEKEEVEGRRIPMTEIAANMRVSYLTLNKLRKPEPKGCQISTIEALCEYFDKKVEDVLVEVPE